MLSKDNQATVNLHDPQRNATYAGMVESVDDSVARIVAKVDEFHLTDRTVIILTFDNDGLMPRHLASAARQQRPLYEGGIPVPWIDEMAPRRPARLRLRGPGDYR
jgi:arylsulfatase A-like enzyme